MTLVGYRGTYSLQFECQTSQTGLIIDKIIALTEVFIQSISYKATNKEIEASQKLALSQATLNAIASIKEALSKTQYRMTEIYNINVSNGSVSTMNKSDPNIAAMEMDIPVIGSDFTVSSSVHVQALFE